MGKSVLISIKPRWCELIANGKKTIEVRKTRPKLETPFKCYIYCTNGGRPLVYGDKACASGWKECYTQTYGRSREEAERIWGVLNGKVIGEFVCDKILDISVSMPPGLKPYEIPGTGLTDVEIMNYLGNGINGYGWHISDLVIYDEPKKLSDLHRDCSDCGYVKARFTNCDFIIKRPPQSWRYVGCPMEGITWQGKRPI